MPEALNSVENPQRYGYQVQFRENPCLQNQLSSRPLLRNASESEGTVRMTTLHRTPVGCFWFDISLASIYFIGLKCIIRYELYDSIQKLGPREAAGGLARMPSTTCQKYGVRVRFILTNYQQSNMNADYALCLPVSGNF